MLAYYYMKIPILIEPFLQESNFSQYYKWLHFSQLYIHDGIRFLLTANALVLQFKKKKKKKMYVLL